MENRHRILVSSSIHEDGLAYLRAQTDVDLTVKQDCSETDLQKLLPEMDGIISRSDTSFDKSTIENGRKLKVIARAGVGVDNIDLEAATRQGVLVINCPNGNTTSAAEHTFAILLGLCRHVPKADQTLRSGVWEREAFNGVELSEKTIGIVGLGRVGSRVAQIAHGFGMTVLAYDPYISEDTFAKHRAIPCSTLHELVKQADILTVHVPKTKETKNLIAQREFDLAKQGVIVVNCARGGIISETDLLAAYTAGKVKGYAIDVWEKEPITSHPLFNQERSVCTPHIGASTDEAQQRVSLAICADTLKALRGESVPFPVNVPYIAADTSEKTKQYMVLAERLAAVAHGIAPEHVRKISFFYKGSLAAQQCELVRLSFLKSFISRTTDEKVNFVNVTNFVRDKGLTVEETRDEHRSTYESALSVRLEGKGSLRISGTVFDDHYLRLTAIDDFYYDIDPSGHMLILENEDRPGVIGRIGTLLGNSGINIASWNLSRNAQSGLARAIIHVDSEVSDDVLSLIAKTQDITSIKKVKV